MSYNIDVEVESTSKGFKIHCASLSDVWSVTKQIRDITRLVAAVNKDQDCRDARIPSTCDVGNVGEVEAYINRLGCTVASIKLVAFHNFLEMPSGVRGGLKYARARPFGAVKFECPVIVHARYVRRVGLKRHLKLTQERRNGYLLLFNESTDADPIGTFKIGQSVTIKAIEAIDHAFVVKSVKRQWVLQREDYASFHACLSAINEVLKENESDLITIPIDKHAPPPEPVEEKDSIVQPEFEFARGAITEDDIAALKDANNVMFEEAQRIQDQADNMKDLAETVHQEKVKMTVDAHEMEERITNEIEMRRKEVLDMFRQEVRNLQRHIKELTPLLKAKSAVKNDTSKEEEKDKMRKAKEAGELAEQRGGQSDKAKYKATRKKFEDKVAIDMEREILQSIGDDTERQRIRFKHMHVHKHEYRHIHTHTHVHMDTEQIQEIDDIEDKFQERHIVRHTICHTNTQYLVPSGWFK